MFRSKTLPTSLPALWTQGGFFHSFPFWRGKTAYPEQQLPGVPHELGVPQQPPELGSVNFRDELLDVL
jgi:hypothetical protein